MRHTPTFPTPTFSSWRPHAATPLCVLTSRASAVRGAWRGRGHGSPRPGRAGRARRRRRWLRRRLKELRALSLRRPPEREPGDSRHREERVGSHGGAARGRRLSWAPPPPPPPPGTMSNPGTRRNGSSIKIRLTGNGAAAARAVCGRTSLAGPGSPPLPWRLRPLPGLALRGGAAGPELPALLNFYPPFFCSASTSATRRSLSALLFISVFSRPSGVGCLSPLGVT